jgi:hypothetical protein
VIVTPDREDVPVPERETLTVDCPYCTQTLDVTVEPTREVVLPVHDQATVPGVQCFGSGLARPLNTYVPGSPR